MTTPVSVSRLYLLRGVYLVNLALVGSGVVVAYLQRTREWDPVSGVAYSFWAALAAASALGIRYPVSMLPVLFVQLLYKCFWLVAVYLPLHAAGRSTDLINGMLFGAGLDIIAIPWPYVFAHYLRRSGEPWKARPVRHVTSEENPAA